MIGLARKLEDILNIRHAMHADDVTLRIMKGSLGDKEAKLQVAATCVEQYTRERSLECSTEKCEILRVWPNKLNRTVPADPHIRIKVYH